MRFSKTLEAAILPEWREHYIDYPKLKTILRDNDKDSADSSQPWTEQDANRFSEELFNVQLEKVARFQEDSMRQLTADVDAVFGRLRELAPPKGGEEGDKDKDNKTGGRKDDGDGDASPGGPRAVIGAETAAKLRGLEDELDALTERLRRLKQYSSINYTGFLKIAKKNDRKTARYKVRPLLNVRLAARPINSEQSYSVLLNRLSLMYFAIRQQLEEEPLAPLDPADQGETHDGEKYTAYKCGWPSTTTLSPPVRRHALTERPPSLGPPGQPPRGQDARPPAAASPRVPVARVRVRGPRGPHHHVALL
jgi:SPX domain protein involved in polyphosphate accumulation